MLILLSIVFSIIYLYFYLKNNYNKIYIFNSKNPKNDYLIEKLKDRIESYNPTFYLPNFISILFFHQILKSDKKIFEEKIIKTRDNAKIKLNFYGNNFNNKPLVIFRCGVNGNPNVIYVNYLCQIIEKNNFNIVIINDRMIEENYSKKLIGICDPKDTEDSLDYICENFPDCKKFLLGVSRGGNDITKFLGESKRNYNIISACSISNPFNSLNSIYFWNRSYFGKFFYRFILKDYKKILTRLKSNNHFNNLKKKFNFPIDNINSIKSLFEFDSLITSKICGNDNVFDYYDNINSKKWVSKIKIPILFINSMDDKISKNEYIPIDKIYKNKNCILFLVERGGHIEYFNNNNAEWWAFETSIKYFKQFLNENI